MGTVYYFGCWGGTGHYLWTPAGARPRQQAVPNFPWAQIDGTLCGDPSLEPRPGAMYWPGTEEHQPEGLVRLHHREGWTAVAWWDRSVDRRYGSNAAFFARGTLSAEELVEAARVAFPRVAMRWKYRLKLPLETT